MSALDGHESCAMCGEVLQLRGRYVAEVETAGETEAGEWVWLQCPHGCSEIFVRPDELVAA